MRFARCSFTFLPVTILVATSLLLSLSLASAGYAQGPSRSEIVPKKPSSGKESKESKEEAAARRAKGEINFDDLQFEIEKDQPFRAGMLNEEVKDLEGRTVKLRGYILPSTLFKETDIEEFVLVRDNQECCFGPGAALFDCVIVKMQDGKTTDFVTRPVTVEGKFKIDTESYRYPGGAGPKGASHFAIFQIDGISVK